MLSTAASYSLITKNLTRTTETTAKRADVAREVDYYLKNIEKVKSIDDFMKDARLYRFAMKAHGLEDMAYAKAFMRKILTEGVESKTSFANKLTDIRYREFATTFNFATFGDTATLFADAKQGTVDKYLRQTIETDAGAKNEGVRLALYIQRKAPQLTSAYSILADKALLTVVQTTLGFSPMTALADIDKQAQMISAKLDVADLKDPEKLKKFLNRFATMWDMQNGQTAGASPAAPISGKASLGISANVLASLQGLKLGGR
ncbi:MAG: DUF1217 domain-containing protein [Parvibaculaceae bacterium]